MQTLDPRIDLKNNTTAFVVALVDLLPQLTWDKFSRVEYRRPRWRFWGAKTVKFFPHKSPHYPRWQDQAKLKKHNLASQHEDAVIEIFLSAFKGVVTRMALRRVFSEDTDARELLLSMIDEQINGER